MRSSQEKSQYIKNLLYKTHDNDFEGSQYTSHDNRVRYTDGYDVSLQSHNPKVNFYQQHISIRKPNKPFMTSQQSTFPDYESMMRSSHDNMSYANYMNATIPLKVDARKQLKSSLLAGVQRHRYTDPSTRAQTSDGQSAVYQGRNRQIRASSNRLGSALALKIPSSQPQVQSNLETNQNRGQSALGQTRIAMHKTKMSFR